jgi:hypothetical protein
MCTVERGKRVAGGGGGLDLLGGCWAKHGSAPNGRKRIRLVATILKTHKVEIEVSYCII